MVKQFMIAIDQLLNTIFCGWADETLSARAYRKRGEGYWGCVRTIIDSIFFWQKEHCYQSYVNEIKRKQLPTEYSKIKRGAI